MKSIVIVTLSLLSLIFILPVTLPLPADSATFIVFVASSPCDAVSRPLLKIPETANCELIKWNLTLYHDPNTLAPTTYKLNYGYGIPEQGTNGLSQGGTKVERKGKWTIVRGTKTNPDAIVYQLNPDDYQESVSFQMLDHNLLHLLARDGSLMVGNAGWSYTLNRTGNLGQPTQQARPLATSSVNPTALTTSALPVATDSSTLGRFVGRSPCRDVARELNKAVNADCTKLKWDLILYRDPNRGTPTTYKLKGTFYREHIGEGKWAIVRGTKMNPGAVVYQLDPDKPHGSLLLLKIDDNILLFLDKERNLMVGDGDFSYTLNRIENVPNH